MFRAFAKIPNCCRLRSVFQNWVAVSFTDASENLKCEPKIRRSVVLITVVELVKAPGSFCKQTVGNCTVITGDGKYVRWADRRNSRECWEWLSNAGFFVKVGFYTLIDWLYENGGTTTDTRLGNELLKFVDKFWKLNPKNRAPHCHWCAACSTTTTSQHTNPVNNSVGVKI